MKTLKLSNHAVYDIPLEGDLNQNSERIIVGMGCFWGAERCFWELTGVLRTAVGYAGGESIAPGYLSVCSGSTGHAEVVEVIYDSSIISIEELLKAFWENHDPTQGMRQGNDKGSQYRSIIISTSEQQAEKVAASKVQYQLKLTEAGFGEITTEICSDLKFYLAEDDHQQYLYKNPNGYCGLGGTGACL